jgi:hypothetical protein
MQPQVIRNEAMRIAGTRVDNEERIDVYNPYEEFADLISSETGLCWKDSTYLPGGRRPLRWSWKPTRTIGRPPLN